jgi:hypothetical protein
VVSSRRDGLLSSSLDRPEAAAGFCALVATHGALADVASDVADSGTLELPREWTRQWMVGRSGHVPAPANESQLAPAFEMRGAGR